MKQLLARIVAQKAELDRLREQVGDRLGNLDHAQDLELTYTSNAIEGNTLSAAERTPVIERGITIGDGNGRTARLLMNLILLRAGYPPVAVRPEDRPAYIAALQRAQSGQGTEEFNQFCCSGSTRSSRNTSPPRANRGRPHRSSSIAAAAAWR